MVPLTIACAVACGVLVLAEWRQLAAVRVVAKLIASLAFLAVGVIGVHAWGGYERWMIAGLALGVIGDAALLGKSDRAFLGGLAAFLLGHVAYIVGIAQLASPVHWLGMASYAALLPAGVGAIALGKLWPRLGAMKLPVIGYVLAIVAMVIGALAVRTYNARLAIGAMLFFASDLSVARDKFVDRAFANKAWGLPCYYAGQLAIAWAITA